MANKYWFDDVNKTTYERKMLKKIKKMTNAYYELLGGDNAICGDCDDVWNTIIIPERKLKKESKQNTVKKLIEKYDKNKDGILDSNDY